MLWIIFIIFFVGTFLFWIIHNKNQSSLMRYMNNLQSNQLSLVEQYGANILHNMSNTQKDNITPTQKSNYRSVSWENRQAPPKAKSLLHPDLVELRDRVLAIVTGKYHLNESTVSYLQINMDYVLTYLLQSKVKRGDELQNAVEAILESYNPSFNNDLVLEACRDLMNYEPVSDSKKILVAQYIVNKSNNGDEIQDIYDWIIGLASDDTTPHAIRAEAADMLMLTNNSRYIRIARDILEQLRREDDVIPEPIPTVPVPVIPEVREIRIVGHALPDFRQTQNIPQWLLTQQRQILDQFEARKPKIPRTVFDDGQNVHNSTLNNSVLEAAANIIKDNKTMSPITFDTSLLKDLPAIQRHKVDAALHRISTDSTTFKHGSTLYGLFQSLQSFINSNPNKDELNKRMIEELVDMSGQCATGHLSRLVNVVQGFDAAPKQKIKINIEDEVYAKISHSLSQALKKAENMAAAEAIVMGDDQRLVNEFVANEVNKIAPEITKEYKDIVNPEEVNTQLLSAAKAYTKNDSFSLENNKVVSAI